MCIVLLTASKYTELVTLSILSDSMEEYWLNTSTDDLQENSQTLFPTCMYTARKLHRLLGYEQLVDMVNTVQY